MNAVVERNSWEHLAKRLYQAMETLIVVASENAKVKKTIESWRATLRPDDFKWAEKMFKRLEYNPRQETEPSKPDHTSWN